MKANAVADELNQVIADGADLARATLISMRGLGNEARALVEKISKAKGAAQDLMQSEALRRQATRLDMAEDFVFRVINLEDDLRQLTAWVRWANLDGLSQLDDVRKPFEGSAVEGAADATGAPPSPSKGVREDAGTAGGSPDASSQGASLQSPSLEGQGEQLARTKKFPDVTFETFINANFSSEPEREFARCSYYDSYEPQSSTKSLSLEQVRDVLAKLRAANLRPG